MSAPVKASAKKETANVKVAGQAPIVPSEPAKMRVQAMECVTSTLSLANAKMVSWVTTAPTRNV